MTAPTRTRRRSGSTVERRRADTALERRRAARLAGSAGRATVTAPPELPTRSTPPAKPTRESSGRTRSAAAQRAYARRAQREGRPVEHSVDHAARELGEDHGGRASFVILIIVLLTVGVAATLWLSTQAIADSYRLEHAKQQADQLAERADQLQRDVTKAESASSLAERARAMGMVPAGDPARLVVKPNGRVVVVGEPTRAEKPKPQRPAPEHSANERQRPQAGQHGRQPNAQGAG